MGTKRSRPRSRHCRAGGGAGRQPAGGSSLSVGARHSDSAGQPSDTPRDGDAVAVDLEVGVAARAAPRAPPGPRALELARRGDPLGGRPWRPSPAAGAERHRQRDDLAAEPRRGVRDDGRGSRFDRRERQPARWRPPVVEHGAPAGLEVAQVARTIAGWTAADRRRPTPAPRAASARPARRGAGAAPGRARPVRRRRTGRRARPRRSRRRRPARSSRPAPAAASRGRTTPTRSRLAGPARRRTRPSSRRARRPAPWRGRTRRGSTVGGPCSRATTARSARPVRTSGRRSR